MSLNSAAPRGWLQAVAETCRSTFVNQIFVKLVRNKLVYKFQLIPEVKLFLRTYRIHRNTTENGTKK